MHIKEIGVTKLFGLFDYSIPLKWDEGITIIVGPNGFGKTTLLSLLDAFSHMDIYTLISSPFEIFSLTFSNDDVLRIKRTEVEKLDSPPSSRRENVRHPAWYRWEEGQKGIKIEFILDTADDKVNFEFIVPVLADNSLPFLNNSQAIMRLVPEVRRVGPSLWRDLNSGETITTEQVLQRYQNDIIRNYISEVLQNELEIPEWLNDLTKVTPVFFIDTKRLEQRRESRFFMLESYPERSLYSSGRAVESDSKHLVGLIKQEMEKKSRLAEQLDRTFPIRLIDRMKSEPYTFDTLQQYLDDLDKKRKRLAKAGLLVDEPELNFQLGEYKDDENIRRVLSLYVDDERAKLGLSDNFLEKIELFMNIINKRFLFKSISIDKEKGFVVTGHDGRNIELSHLSSGEQHEMVLFYNLLFRVTSVA